VEDAGERVDVRAPVDRSACHLLRRSVGRGAERGLPADGWHRLAEPACEAEVAQVHVLVGVEQDVRGLDVAVDEAVGVGGVQGGGDLSADRDGACRLGLALRPQQRLQVGAVDVAHHQVQLRVDLARVVDRDDVRVLERRRRLRLRQEARPEVLVPRELRDDQLEGHGPLQAAVVGAVDDAHPAAADKLLEPVAENLAADLQMRRHDSTTIEGFLCRNHYLSPSSAEAGRRARLASRIWLRIRRGRAIAAAESPAPRLRRRSPDRR
jgi:hypothetical protein